MPHVTCNLCGVDNFDIVFKKGVAQLHQIVRCRQCNLMYANPQEHIDCEAMTDGRKPLFDLKAPGTEQYFQKQQVQLADNLRILKVLNSLNPKKGQLLEIGSFAGLFLDRIRNSGWDVTGLEPDAGAARHATETFGLKIINGVLPQPDLGRDVFDAVMMLHVIEHMPDPAENLQAIHRLLKPGGMLVIETPRFDSLMFKLLGRRERSLSNCNGHIYFFTIPTLTRLLQKLGFDVVRADKVGRTLTLDRLIYNVGVILRRGRLFRLIDRATSLLPRQKIRLHINVCDMQRIYCRKR